MYSALILSTVLHITFHYPVIKLKEAQRNEELDAHAEKQRHKGPHRKKRDTRFAQKNIGSQSNVSTVHLWCIEGFLAGCWDFYLF